MFISVASSGTIRGVISHWAKAAAISGAGLLCLAFAWPLSPLLIVGALLVAVELLARVCLGFTPDRYRTVPLAAAMFFAHSFVLALAQEPAGKVVAHRLFVNLEYGCTIAFSAAVLVHLFRRRLVAPVIGA